VARTPKHAVHPSHAGARRRRGLWSGRRGRALVLLIIVAAAGGGYALGLRIAHHDNSETAQLIQQLRSEGQKLKKQITDQAASLISLQSKYADVETAMHAMKPAQNTYDLKPNESIIAADGRLTLGLVGSPANSSIDINVNGKRQTVAPGDVINVAPDAATKCLVSIQSFDMFQATINATCTAAK
jgi:hypothetical protein